MAALSDRPPLFALDRKLSHEEINSLPLASYTGVIQVVRSREQVLHAVRELRNERVLGFDTETRPAFRKGESYPPALLQLAGSSAVYLFHLQSLGLPAEVAELLADPRIVKAGVAVGRDLLELRRLTEFQPRGFVDLGERAENSGIAHHGLRGLAALLLGCRIPKSAQLTNWARPHLPSNALRYAATDAWLGRRLHEAMAERGVVSKPGGGGGAKGFWRQCLDVITRKGRDRRKEP